jgi:hypothetical protein
LVQVFTPGTPSTPTLRSSSRLTLTVESTPGGADIDDDGVVVADDVVDIGVDQTRRS